MTYGALFQTRILGNDNLKKKKIECLFLFFENLVKSSYCFEMKWVFYWYLQNTDVKITTEPSLILQQFCHREGKKFCELISLSTNQWLVLLLDGSSMKIRLG